MNRRVTAMTAVLALASGDALAAGCNHDRACLEKVMDTYLAAVVGHDPGLLPVRRNVRYTENGVRLNLGDGLWQTASAAPTYRLDIIDEEAGQVGLLGRIEENGNNNWFAVRLKVENDGQVSQIETLLNRSISVQPQAATSHGNTDPAPLMAQEIPVDHRASRALLAAAGNA